MSDTTVLREIARKLKSRLDEQEHFGSTGVLPYLRGDTRTAVGILYAAITEACDSVPQEQVLTLDQWDRENEIDALRHHYVCALGISGGCEACHQYNEALARLFKRKGWSWEPQHGGDWTARMASGAGDGGGPA